MRRQRVVVTGMGAISPYGEGVSEMMKGLHQHSHAFVQLPPSPLGGLTCRVGGIVPSLDTKRIPRDLRRCMSPMSIFACLAAWEALAQAGLPSQGLSQVGVALGSTLGSPATLHDFFEVLLRENSVESIRSTSFFKVMGHTVAANVALACGCRRRTLAPAAACASGLMGICLGYEAISSGLENMMLCGGADEWHPLVPATFERLGASSSSQDPDLASRPFDLARTGIVCGEGAGILLLESLESAQERNAHILAEILGTAMVSSPASIAHPDEEAIANCMLQALDNAEIDKKTIVYINAHATATEYGDIAEGQAIAHIFGTDVPISSLKGHFGHTMAASGALESVACIEMLRSSVYFPTKGCHTPDSRCGNINIFNKTISGLKGPILKNSFALGGCNCSVLYDIFQ